MESLVVDPLPVSSVGAVVAGETGSCASGSAFAVSYSSILMILNKITARHEPARGPTQ